MKSATKLTLRHSRFLHGCLANFVTTAVLMAQGVAPAKPPVIPNPGEVVELSPFQVSTDKDTSYGALNSNSISAINMELFKTPVAADIFTEEFMRDVATTNVEDLLSNYGASNGQVLATPDTDSLNNQPGDRGMIGGMGSRGVIAGQPRRNGFSGSASNANSHDTFDIERVEVLKGSNALLFGAGGAGGVINTSTKQAKFSRTSRPMIAGSASLRIDQFGSQRAMFDVNYGLKNYALRFVVLDDVQKYRKLFVDSKTKAYYGALAVRLPLNTTLRLNVRKNDNNRITPTATNDLSFTNATRDPRHLFSLSYLLATNQAGAVNPKTGAAYPGGAIANGLLSWENYASWGGWCNEEDITTDVYTLSIDTVWSSWLSTSIGAMYDNAVSTRGVAYTSLLAPRAFNSGNPYDDWAMGSPFQMQRNNDIYAGRRHSYRANAVVTNEFLKGQAKSQTVLGWDLNFGLGIAGYVHYQYYQADPNFQMYSLGNPRPAAAGGTTGADQLGRYTLPTLYWPVGAGPIKQPGWRIGMRQVTVGGTNYVLSQTNPQNANWVTPLNPLGLASMVPGQGGVNASNLAHGARYTKDGGLYGANYTRWFDDRFTTLFGFRTSNSFGRTANTSTTGTQGWYEKEADYSSFNLGLTYRLKPWLYAYYNFGKTFLPNTRAANDYYGELPKDTTGLSQEIGFKYESDDGRFSGSVAYYITNSKDEVVNFGAAWMNLINPAGLNGAFNPALRGQWVNANREAKGIEVILTAAPTTHWRARLGLSTQGGKFKTGTSYPILWNDDFHYNKTTGGVTYADGTPFMVPTDAAGIATVNTVSALREPVVGATNAQLTIGMMSDPTSDYFAYGKGGNESANGSLVSGTTVFRALRWFQIPSGQQNIQARTLNTGKPLSAIPYAYHDPSNLNGVGVVCGVGDATTGFPRYSIVLTNTYDFTEGRLRGTTIGATVNVSFDTPTYWYTEPDATGGTVRKLYKQTDVTPMFNPFIAYGRKMGRYQFRSQLNVSNMFNNYRVEIRPALTTGYTIESSLNATWIGTPRQWTWTNTLSF